MGLDKNSIVAPERLVRLPFTAVILNGGKARRYGGADKQSLLIGDTPMGRALAAVLRKAADELFIIGRPDSMYDDLADGQYEDLVRGRGPLEGLRVAMRHASHRWILLCATDMPFASLPLIMRLFEIAAKEESEIVTIEFNNVFQPFYSFYRRDLAEAIDVCIESQSNLSLWNFIRARQFAVLPSQEVASICDGDLVFQNINDPASYEKALALARSRGFPC